MTDIYDRASQIEEEAREAAIDRARRPVNRAISDKRRRLAIAHEIASQRGVDDPEVQNLGIECENGCGDPVTVESEDIFCSKECAADWERRERARVISGH